VDSNQCRVRISDPNDPACSDTTDDFTIFVCPGLTGDIDGDCYVTAVDYAFLAHQWLDLPGEPPADIAPDPPDGFVDWLDLCALACDWLRCGNPFDAGCLE
jgi:hypothetical protein